ncbi:uncharacterized protein LAESUDRAFT_724539 [Laetiporus sulphureus 93-53]|uniref:BTB domain-containing protein n=1 Tax=Laetiporus sulphureus 93-53 TaxID=1314785 RepID=A0A165ER27_9APHY|nr:uncharacterized protein LAESUDRAFT_724539 [Laetiporus sulphureus 93-53]KZT07588.1 hypothetical protein LAESUDRAFT_724539 [Laetiporus sulphureus 93-53]
MIVKTRNSKFFFDGGTVILKIRQDAAPIKEPQLAHEEIIYKVHRYFLERDSEIFRTMFSCPPVNGVSEGDSEDTAILLPEVTQEEIDTLLSFLYHGMYGLDYSLSQWRALLLISSRYMFHEIRERAIQELDAHKPQLDPVDRIVLSKKLDINDWLGPAYVELCTRDKTLSLKEANELGLETSMVLVQIRDDLMRDRFDNLTCQRCRAHRGGRVDQTSMARELVKKNLDIGDVFDSFDLSF